MAALSDKPVLSTNVNPLDEVDFNPQIPADLENEEVARRRLSEAATIRTLEDEESNIVNSYLETELQKTTQNITATEARQLSVISAIENTLAVNQDLAQEQIRFQPELADLTVEALAEVNQEAREEGQRADAPYQVLTKQLQNPSLVTEEDRNNLAVRAALADQVHALIAEDGLWGLLGDIALELVPTKFVTDIIQATDSFNPLAWEDRVRELVGEYQLMSPAEQLERVPVLQSELQEFLPPFRVAQIITAIIDPSTEEELAFQFGPLGIADAALTAAGFLSIASRAKNLFNLPKLANQAGDVETAAKINTTILVDETNTASTVTGVEKATAVNNSTPLNVGKFDPAADNTMSGAVFNKVVAFRDALRERLSTLSEGEAFIPEATIADADIPAAVRRIDGVFEQHVAELAKKEKIVDVTRVDKTVGPRGVTYDFIYKDKIAQQDDIGTFTREFVRDDNGIFHQDQYHDLGG